MKTNYKYTMLKWCLTVACFCLFAVSCDNDDLNTDQLNSGDVTLLSFGPCPIARGGELRLIGSNIHKVTSVQIPGSAAISEIRVISNTEIRVTVPQDAQSGPIVLTSPEGEITSLTPITYSEPIGIDAISPTTLKAGQELTISGEYLNLIEEVIFFDDVHVLKADFTSHSRKEIKVIVPVEAQSGKVIVSNGTDLLPEDDPNYGVPTWIYSEEELNVILPVITSVTPLTVKAGNTIVVTGSHFDLVRSVQFSGDVTAALYTVNNTHTELTVTVPAAATDGPISLVAASGVEVVSKGELTLVVPSSLKVTPQNVKNNGEISITGNDLDLVSEVLFGEVVADILSISPGELKVKVPEEASATTIILNTLAGKSVETPAFAYVRPVISEIAPTTLMAGSNITIKGSDLDLVKSVRFSGTSEEGAIASKSEGEMEVTVPTSATSGVVTLITVNGTEIVSSESLTVEAADIPVISEMPEQVKPGEMMTIRGSKLNLVESVVFADGVKATEYGSRTESLLEVRVPANAKTGNVRLTLNTYNGKEVVSNLFKVAGTDPIIYPELVIDDFENHNGHDPSWDNWGGSYSYEADEDSNHFLKINPGTSSWAWVYGCNHQSNRGGNFPAIANPADYNLKIDVRVSGTLPADLTFQISLGGWSNGFNLLTAADNYTTGGAWMTVTIPMSDIWFNGAISGTGDYGMSINGGAIPGDVEISIDNIRYEPK